MRTAITFTTSVASLIFGLNQRSKRKMFSEQQSPSLHVSLFLWLATCQAFSLSQAQSKDGAQLYRDRATWNICTNSHAQDTTAFQRIIF